MFKWLYLGFLISLLVSEIQNFPLSLSSRRLDLYALADWLVIHCKIIIEQVFTSKISLHQPHQGPVTSFHRFEDHPWLNKVVSTDFQSFVTSHDQAYLSFDVLLFHQFYITCPPFFPAEIRKCIQGVSIWSFFSKILEMIENKS